MADTSAHRFRTLDGWRGVCALLVALHHFPAHGFVYALPLVRNAWLLVDFFFVLSGFVIAYAYGERLSNGAQIKSFALRRFLRLWPLHAVILCGFVTLEVVGFTRTGVIFTGGRSLYALCTNLLLVQALGLHRGLTWNTPSWSISTEFWTYLIFAAACFLLPRMRAAISIGLIALSIAILVFISRFGMRETFEWGIARCVFGFFTGVLTHDIWARGWLKRLGGSTAEIGAVLFALAYLIFIPGNRALEYLAPPVFACLVLVFANGRGLVSEVMDRRAVNALGRWSYSIYMVHMLVLAMIASALNIANFTGWRADALTLGYIACVAGVSAYTWRWVEIPGQRLFVQNVSRASLATASPSEPIG
ncbi:MAG: acyltransferase [Proteobacteria bacterium]|nr:acyltransferase [Pseudomonadota bacterium]